MSVIHRRGDRRARRGCALISARGEVRKVLQRNRRQSSLQSRPGFNAEAQMEQRSPRRIVVADDNEDSAESFAMLLSFSGHEVRVAHDGAAALDAVRDFRPDVAFLDIGMPGLTGYEVAQAVRAEPWGRDIKLIAVTGWGQPDDRVRARTAGFDRHLIKPIDPAEVDRLLDA